MEINTIHNESCLDTLKKMPDNFIDCVITSPPYWQLRDYGYEGQWGLEPTFNEYLEHLWQMMDEIYRALKPEGTCWINLGDTYGTQGGKNTGKAQKKYDSTYIENRVGVNGEEDATLIKEKGLHKCLLLIPHRFAIGCIDRKWIVRNDCIWAKRNGMPESVTDRFSKKHEYFFFMVKSEKYFFDLDAIRDKHKTHNIIKDLGTRGKQGFSFASGNQRDNSGGLGYGKTKIKFGGNKGDGNKEGIYSGNEWTPREDGKNPGSVSDFWDIPTRPSTNEHYASYNDALLLKPVLAGCPEDGIIYDPFMGTGSTAEVALRAKRKFIGSEISKEYIDICNQRLEPFLTQHKLF